MKPPMLIITGTVAGMLIFLSTYSQTGLPEGQSLTRIKQAAPGYGKKPTNNDPLILGFGKDPLNNDPSLPVVGRRAHIDKSVLRSLRAILAASTSNRHWQVQAGDVLEWMEEEKNDFVVVDVRPNPEEYIDAHIPGAMHIPYNELLTSENLSKLPIDKKVVLACVTGQTQNLPVLALRLIGYDARTMAFGHTAWIAEYRGGRIMESVIEAAVDEEYPVVRGEPAPAGMDNGLSATDEEVFSGFKGEDER